MTYKNITVIPDDKVIIIDGKILNIRKDFGRPFHALQWRNETGHIEMLGGSNILLGERDFVSTVKPYVDLWEIEAQLQADEKRQAEEEETTRRNSPEYLAEQARTKRDGLLYETDYLLMPDYSLSSTFHTAIVAYRQALRDITAQVGFPKNINWPIRPKL